MFRTGNSRQFAATLTYMRHRVFEMGSNRQPVVKKILEVQIDRNVISELYGDEWSGHREDLASLTPGKGVCCPCIGKQVDPRVGLGVWKKTESLTQTGNGTRLPWSSSTWSWHYIDYASLAETACTRNVFGTGSSMQPVAAISFISAALFVHPKVSGRKVTREV